MFAILCYAAFVTTGSGSITGYLDETEPFRVVLLLTAVFALACFVTGAVSGDYSWVDRCWSLAPIIYGWLYARSAGYASPSVIAAVLVSIWGARLTFNFARKGGFTGLEDYRWPILRQKIGNPFLWQVFNALFICGFQVTLFALFTAPLDLIARASQAASPFLFGLAAVLAFLAIAWETAADEQQWRFHKAKAAGRTAGKWAADVERGFLSSGLFRYSRHPAYFGELSFWWLVYVLSAAATGRWLNWTVAGPLILTALFVGSTMFTEAISGSKYPAYSAYKAGTSAVIPWPPDRGGEDTALEESN